jgi:nuclear pore complex protein Nup155
LLVLTTPIEIIVLGVTFNEKTKAILSSAASFKANIFEEMQLMNKPIFVLSTDNIAITCVEGTSDGRIFLGGRDGCLYEICYQAETNWFGKRCKKKNHSQSTLSYVLPGFLKGFSDDPILKIVIDDQRSMLYILTEKGAIEAWDLSDDLARRITRMSQNDIMNAAINHIKTIDSSIFKPVIDLCILPRNEYLTLHIIAVTQCGVRLYFGGSTGSFQTNLDLQQQHNKINNFYLQHVRLPPGYTPNTNYGKPKSVHSIFYNAGSVIMISSPQQDQDIVWSMSAEPFLHSELSPFISNDSTQRMLAESSTILQLDGLVWAVEEIKDKNQLTVKFPLREAQNPKKVIILTSQGAHIVELLKPVDILQQIFLYSHGAHHDAIKAFFEIQTDAESCATSLILACKESNRGTEIAMWAAQAFFRYGGEPHFINQQLFQQPQNFIAGNSQEIIGPRAFMSTPYAQTVIQQSQIPPVSSYQQQQQLDLFHLKYSAKHGGLYLHISRIMRPIWMRQCINEQNSSTITIEDCNQILSDLFSLRFFLESNSILGMTNSSKQSNLISSNQSSNSFVHSHSFVSSSGHLQQLKKEEAFIEEKKSLSALVNFTKYICEVISLWKILCEHQLHVLLNQLSSEQQQAVKSCSFRELILMRSDLCAILIVTIINSYLNDNASVKQISEKLREVCPTLYRNEDAVSHKATEILKLSKTLTNDDERQESFLKALDLCFQAAPKLPLVNICQQFLAAGFYEGVIKICSVFANKLDPNETALHFYRNNYPFDINQIQGKDQEGYVIYNARMKCYEEVKNMLQHLYRNINVQITQEKSSMTHQLQHILNIALQSVDQLLHVAVYEWMLFNNLFVEMLSITNASLGDFLSRCVNQTAINLQLADLLWKYYERNGQHSSAAKILNKLATLHSENIVLTKRIEYLARAVMCMRSDSTGFSVNHGEILRDLEDKLEVAQVQKQVYDTLSLGGIKNFDPIQVREAVKSLDMRLFNMSQLYSDFAENFDLWECQLTILNCSHHNEPRLINSVWSHILDKEMEEIGESAMKKSERLLSKVQSLAIDFGVGPCFPLSKLLR